jgi:hypothetical protein
MPMVKLVLHRSVPTLTHKQQVALAQSYIARLKHSHCIDWQRPTFDHKITASIDARLAPPQCIDADIFDAELRAAGFKLKRRGMWVYANIRSECSYERSVSAYCDQLHSFIWKRRRAP